jgi:putative ABC transport system permease protein
MTLASDLRVGWRALRRSPVFTATSVLALALGIGGVTAVLTLADALLLRLLPYRDPGRLVAVTETIRRATLERRSVSNPNFEDWRAQARSFEKMAVYDGTGAVLGAGDDVERVSAERVSPAYFGVLGVTAALGRVLAETDDAGQADAVVVLSHGLWTRRFGAAPDVVGRTIVVDDKPARVCGVGPHGFRGLTDAAELFVAFRGPLGIGHRDAQDRGERWLDVVARLAPGVTAAAAQAEMDGIAARLEAAHRENEARGALVAPLDGEFTGPVRPVVAALGVAVFLVLLIACANVANLMLARVPGRKREMAIRAALGARRARLVRQLLTESALLAGAGALLGLLLASWTLGATRATDLLSLPSFVDAAVGGRSVLVAAGAAAFTTLLFGTLPALRAADADVSETLNQSGRAIRGGGERGRQALVGLEVALALVLLVGAGLLLRSAGALQRFDPGFTPAGLAALRLTLPAARYEPARAVQFGTELVDRLRAAPGVEAAALASDVPMGGQSAARNVRIEGRDQDVTQPGGIRVYYHLVGDGYLEALKIRVRGRTFTPADRDLGPDRGVVIVSETMARRHWPDGDAIGARLRAGDRSLEVVGVAADVKQRRLVEAATADPDVYMPICQWPRAGFWVVARSSNDVAGALASVRRVANALDPGVPTFAATTANELVAEETARSRVVAALVAGLACVALLLAAVGVYGVAGYTVAQRTQEIGTRIALGATPGDVLRLVVGQGLAPVAIGLLAGALAALGFGRVLEGLLVGVRPRDPLTLITTMALLGGIALLASYLPARRATRIDPAAALRSE